MLRTATRSPGTLVGKNAKLATLLCQNRIKISSALNLKCAAAHFLLLVISVEARSYRWLIVSNSSSAPVFDSGT